MFKDNDLDFTAVNNEVQGNERILFEGTFTKYYIQFVIKEQLIKKSTAFWQIITVAPNTPKNKTLAQGYINSINVL
ncbi:MAG: hypothetical protein LE178_02900 [Endomicrobium sp.]|nr:hypothetical protein [Endomicrobium sp.]